MNAPKADPLAPLWQRAVCAIFAAGGAFGVLLGVVTIFSRSEFSIEALIWPALGAWGCFIFGRAAVTGRLPQSMQASR